MRPVRVSYLVVPEADLSLKYGAQFTVVDMVGKHSHAMQGLAGGLGRRQRKETHRYTQMTHTYADGFYLRLRHVMRKWKLQVAVANGLASRGGEQKIAVHISVYIAFIHMHVKRGLNKTIEMHPYLQYAQYLQRPHRFGIIMEGNNVFEYIRSKTLKPMCVEILYTQRSGERP